MSVHLKLDSKKLFARRRTIGGAQKLLAQYFICNTRRKRRNCLGIYMVETLVAMLLGALFCFTLLQMLSQTMSVTSHNANQQNAALFAQTVLDSVKAHRYQDIFSSIGSYPLLINSSNPGEFSTGGHYLPLGLNIGTLNWTDKATGNKFPGTATLDIKGSSDSTSLEAIVTITWTDSQTKKGKTVLTMTEIHPKGVNYWR